jgi:hypothetical protein
MQNKIHSLWIAITFVVGTNLYSQENRFSITNTKTRTKEDTIGAIERQYFRHHLIADVAATAGFLIIFSNFDNPHSNSSTFYSGAIAGCSIIQIFIYIRFSKRRLKRIERNYLAGVPLPTKIKSHLREKDFR